MDTPKFTVGQTVYHKAKGEQGVVVALLDYSDCYRYKVAFSACGGEVECSPFELTDQKTFDGVEA